MSFGWASNHGFGKTYLPLPDGSNSHYCGPKMLPDNPDSITQDMLYTSKTCNLSDFQKSHVDGENTFGEWGHCECQGWRFTQEDNKYDRIITDALTEYGSIDKCNGKQLGWMGGVFDGHGSNQMSEALYYNLANCINKQPEFKTQEPEDIMTALMNGFKFADICGFDEENWDEWMEHHMKDKTKEEKDAHRDDMLENYEMDRYHYRMAGSTAVLVYVTDKYIYTANTGDSRACMYNENTGCKQLT